VDVTDIKPYSIKNHRSMKAKTDRIYHIAYDMPITTQRKVLGIAYFFEHNYIKFTASYCFTYPGILKFPFLIKNGKYFAKFNWSTPLSLSGLVKSNL
jgi:hypothetical protein